MKDMKTRKPKARRIASLLTALVLSLNLMAPGMVTVASAAGIEDDVTVTASVTVEVSPSEAPVPDDAGTDTKTSETTDASGNTTTSTTTDKTWSSEDHETSEFESTGTTGSIPDDILSAEDGTYSKTETEAKTDTDTTVTGSEHREEHETADAGGNKTSDGWSVEGSQDTEIKNTTTVKDTTTTVTKETGEVEKTDGEKTEGPVTDDGQREQAGDTDVSDREVEQGGADTSGSGSSVTDADVAGLEGTVGPGKTEDTDEKPAEAPRPTDEETKAALAGYAGYDLLDADGNVIGTVQEDGTVSGADGSFLPEWTQDPDTGAWSLSVKAEKRGDAASTGTEKGDGTVQGGASIENKDPSTDPEWAAEWEKSTATLPDGTTVDTYTHKGTGQRVDTKTWTELYTEVVHMRQEIDRAEKTITITPGEGSTMKVTWTGADGETGEVEFSGGATEAEIKALVQRAMQEAYVSPKWQQSHLFWGQDLASYQAKVTANSGLNIRKDPDGSSKKLGAIPKGTDVTVLATVTNPKDGGTWGRVSYKDANGKACTGWVSLNYAAALDDDPGIVLDEDAFRLTGGALQSTVLQNVGGRTESNGAWLREMVDANGNKIYVYCAEHYTDAEIGAEYKLDNVAGTLDNKDLTEDQIKGIQYIAENGYWGSGLDSVKALLDAVKIGDKSAFDFMDEGMALAVTQAAIWYHTNAVEYDEETFTKCYAFITNKHGSYNNLDPEETQAAQALFDALIAGRLEDKTTDLLTTDDIVSTGIKINGKAGMADVEDAVAGLEADAAANRPERYDTDVSFTVAVVKDRMHGDGMKVIVYQGTNEDGTPKAVAEKTLSELESVEDGNGNTTYTVRNVPLDNGVNISLNLEGVQDLAKGAYLFRSELDLDGTPASQTMVGVSDGSGKREVNLTVGMAFDVNAGSIETKTDAGKRHDTETWTETTDYIQDKKQDVTTEELYEQKVTVKTTVSVDTDVTTETQTERVVWKDGDTKTYDRPYTPPGEPDDPTPPDEPDDPTPPDEPDELDVDVPDPDVPLTETPDIPEENIPEEAPPEDAPVEDIPEEDVPLAEIPEIPEIDIPDQDVPLSDIPQTGDEFDAALYVLMAAAGVAGIAWYAMGRRKAED